MTDIDAHKAAVAEMGCIITGSPAPTLHHCRSGSMSQNGIHCGGAQKPSDWLILPLAADYHTGQFGIHPLGVLTWEGIFGSQFYHLCQVSKRLKYNVFERAGYEIRIEL